MSGEESSMLRQRWDEMSESMKSSGAMGQIDALVFIMVVRFGNVTERVVTYPSLVISHQKESHEFRKDTPPSQKLPGAYSLKSSYDNSE